MTPLRRTLQPGLYRLTVDGDGRAFNWEELYIVLNIYNNQNQRTGPWDFNLLENNRPVLPAYWVSVNGRKIGLWYFNRPSDEQIKTRRFKGEASFWIETAGEYEFQFEPYRDFTLPWAKTEFAADPDDSLLAQVNLPPQAQRPMQRLFDAACWKRFADRLADPSFPYHALLSESLAWAMTADRGSVPLPLLAANYRARHDAAALARARAVIEQLLALPAWGNPRADGYGHNGDMGAAQVILDLTITLNWLEQELGADLGKRILARLEQQADRFLELALLHRGYWGGSILQDHGFCSITNFSTAAYGLAGWTPRAEHWLRFCLPRMQRTLNALPTDGCIPPTSYHLLALYTDKVMLFRPFHLHATGEDILERPALRNISHYAFESFVPETGHLLQASCRASLTRVVGGHPFLEMLARKFDDPLAAHLAREYVRLATTKGFYHGIQEQAAYLGTLWAALFHEPVNLPLPPQPPRRLTWFRDAGAVVYRDEGTGLLLSTRCGPPSSATSYRNTTSPCDRICLAPMNGNFAVIKHGRPLLHVAEGGYKMRTELGNIVLVDGQGQRGDHGPPMSNPDAPYGGEHVVAASFDPPSGTGRIVLDLTQAYDPSLGIQRHLREWRFEADGRLRLADTLTARAPRRFTWLFHTYKSQRIDAPAQNRFTIHNHQESLQLELASATAPLVAAVKDTLVVWAYCNENDSETFQHLEWETSQSQRELRAEYILT